MKYSKCSKVYTAKPIQILMGNSSIHILSLPNIHPSVTLSKSDRGGVPSVMTSLVPVGDHCLLARRVQLTSTHRQ